MITYTQETLSGAQNKEIRVEIFCSCKSSENKTEAKCLTKLLGGKWSSSISGKTTVLVVGPRAYWKCNGKKTQAAKKYRREGGKIKFWTSKQFGCYLLNRSASKSKKAKP